MTVLYSLLAMLSCSTQGYTDLDVDGFAAKIQEKGIILIDVRTPDEYTAGHISGASNVDWFGKDFLEQVEQNYPKGTPLAVYCRSGKRSAAASAILSKAGYTVYNLDGGFIAWSAANKEFR